MTLVVPQYHHAFNITSPLIGRLVMTIYICEKGKYVRCCMIPKLIMYVYQHLNFFYSNTLFGVDFRKLKFFAEPEMPRLR